MPKVCILLAAFWYCTTVHVFFLRSFSVFSDVQNFATVDLRALIHLKTSVQMKPVEGLRNLQQRHSLRQRTSSFDKSVVLVLLCFTTVLTLTADLSGNFTQAGLAPVIYVISWFLIEPVTRNCSIWAAPYRRGVVWVQFVKRLLQAHLFFMARLPSPTQISIKLPLGRNRL